VLAKKLAVEIVRVTKMAVSVPLYVHALIVTIQRSFTQNREWLYRPWEVGPIDWPSFVRPSLHSRVRIKPDLTKKQRQEDEEFKKTLDEENKANPKDESGDYRWKLAGPPGNLRKVKERNVKEWEESQKARAAMQVNRERR
jgi:hypothetical protein